MEYINTLVKPTHQCNMRCKYCFAEKYGYDKEILDIEKLKKYFALLSKKYSYINVIWHGGEPLLVPLDFYSEIYNFCKTLNSKFIYSLQTNGTLLNDENINFFKNNNTNIGLSFDGLYNENTRGNTKRIIDNIELLHNNNLYPCDRLCVDEYKLENIDSIDSIEEVFETKSFINLLQYSIERRKECILNCDIYENCYGGCNANSILYKNDISNISCYIHKEILIRIKEYLNFVIDESNYNNMNDYFVKELKLRS